MNVMCMGLYTFFRISPVVTTGLDLLGINNNLIPSRSRSRSKI